MIRTTAIFRCVVTMKNGTHKIMRVTIDMVARITTAFREHQKSIFKDIDLLIVGCDVLNFLLVDRIKFINERTNEEYLTLA